MHDSADFDDFSNKNIEKHSLNDSDKENNVKTRRARTKKDQLDLIVEFHNNHNEMSDINTIDQNWNDLVEKLNSIGPPNNSSNEWKRVWTEHKYNKKRKRVDNEAESNLIFIAHS